MEQNNVFISKNLCFSYDTELVLNSINFSIPKGKITTIMGSNGCGKSTLLHILTKNLKGFTGEISLGNHPISDIGLMEFARQVAIVHQYNTAPEDLTVEEVVYYGRNPYQKLYNSVEEQKENHAKVERAIKITGIEKLKNRTVQSLSGGQRQRVWIAMALAQDTKILLLDEPTTYLDVRYQLQILKLVKMLNRKCGITIVMVLHDINQALAYSDEIIALSRNGKVITQGAPKDVIIPKVIKAMYGIDLEITQVKECPFVITV